MMSGQKKSFTDRYGLLLWCTGLTIAYQLIVHVFMARNLPEGESLEESEEVCVLNPEPGAAQSVRCQEVQMFHKWQMTAPAPRRNGSNMDDEFVVRKSRADEALKKLAITSAVDSTTPAPKTANKEVAEEDEGGEDESVPLLDRIEKAQREMCEEPRHRDYDFCRELRKKWDAKEARRKEGTSEDEAMPLLERIEHAQQEMCEEAAHKNYSFCVELQAKLAAKARKQKLEATLREVSSRTKLMETFMAPAAHEHVHAGQLKAEMQHRVHDLEESLEGISRQHQKWLSSFEKEAVAALREMCAAPHRRDDPKCKELMSAAENHPHHNLTQELQDHNAELHAQAEANAAEHAIWEHKFEDEATAFHRKLCQDPERRDRKDCIDFLKAHPAHRSANSDLREQSVLLEAHMKQLAASHTTWEHNFEEQVRQAHEEMCKDPSRRHRKDCEEFLAHQPREAALAPPAPAPPTAARALRGGAAAQAAPVPTAPAQAASSSGGRGLRGSAARAAPQQLQWQLVKDEAFTSQSGLHRRLNVLAETVQHRDWVGELPKVALLTALPIGMATADSLGAFVDDFRAQTARYGGETQLNIIYHFEDEHTANLVHLFEDGLIIKGHATRGIGSFPSTADLRFGAWSAAEDAQVIVHWSWEAKHSPDRLAMQVRAMAYSGRPVSLLQGARTLRDGFHQENWVETQDETIAGYRPFIWKNWYPQMDQPETPTGIDDGKVVVVDMRAHLV